MAVALLLEAGGALIECPGPVGVSDRSAFCKVCTIEDGSDDFMIWGTVYDWQAPRLD